MEPHADLGLAPPVRLRLQLVRGERLPVRGEGTGRDLHRDTVHGTRGFRGQRLRGGVSAAIGIGGVAVHALLRAHRERGDGEQDIEQAASFHGVTTFKRRKRFVPASCTCTWTGVPVPDSKMLVASPQDPPRLVASPAHVASSARAEVPSTRISASVALVFRLRPNAKGIELYCLSAPRFSRQHQLIVCGLFMVGCVIFSSSILIELSLQSRPNLSC